MTAQPRFIRFKQSDITRAAKGLTGAGIHEFRIEIDPNGKIVILAGPQAARTAQGSSWDDL